MAHDVLIGALAKLSRRRGDGGGARIALLDGENARPALGRLAAPAALHVEHVHRIARREGRERDEPGIGEPAQALETGGVAHRIRHLARPELERVPDPPLEGGQMRGRRAIRVAEGKLGGELGKVRELRERAQLLERGGKAMREQAQGHRLARTHSQPKLPVEAHLAVAAEADGAHVDGLDHGAPAADQRAFRADHGPAARHDRDVRGGAAHVRDHEIALGR